MNDNLINFLQAYIQKKVLLGSQYGNAPSRQLSKMSINLNKIAKSLIIFKLQLGLAPKEDKKHQRNFLNPI